MQKKLLGVSSILLLFLLTTSCQQSSIIGDKQQITASVQSNTTIRGVVEFPQNFKTNSTIADFAPLATVSILNPPNHPNAPNKTIATGLTDSGGIFSITPNSDFSPAQGDIFILDSIKRIGSGGEDLVSLSTYIRWTTSGWESMTIPSLIINTKTTALTIITDSQPSDITPADTIGKLDISSGTTVIPSDINLKITATLITSVASLVNTAITKNADPIRYVKYEYNKYVIVNPDIIN